MWWRWTLVTGKVFSIQLDRQRLKVWFYIRGRDVAASKPIQTLPAGTGISSIAMFSSSGSHQWGWEGWPTRGSQCSPWQIYPRSCAWCISRDQWASPSSTNWPWPWNTSLIHGLWDQRPRAPWRNSYPGEALHTQDVWELLVGSAVLCVLWGRVEAAPLCPRADDLPWLFAQLFFQYHYLQPHLKNHNLGS